MYLLRILKEKVKTKSQPFSKNKVVPKPVVKILKEYSSQKYNFSF